MVALDARSGTRRWAAPLPGSGPVQLWPVEGGVVVERVRAEKPGHGLNAATGEYVDFMTGFVTPDGQVWGRPVAVAEGRDGALLVSDDGGECVWRISYR